MKIIETPKWIEAQKKNSTSEAVVRLLELQTNLKILHWQTSSFAQHEAFGKIYDALTDLIDDFVEIAIGRNGQFKLTTKSIKLEEIGSFKQVVSDGIEYLEGLDTTFKGQSDLINLRDEMLGSLNKLQFLLKLD